MLRWIVRKRLTRLYDVVSIIILSAAVNVLVWGFTILPKNQSVEFYIGLMFCFLSMAGSGWCLYWMHDEVEYSLRQTVGVEGAAIAWIREQGKTRGFQVHFILAVVGLVVGIATLWLVARI